MQIPNIIKVDGLNDVTKMAALFNGVKGDFWQGNVLV